MARIKELLIKVQDLEEQNQQLKVDNDFLQRQNNACKLRCSEYSQRITELESEIADLKFTKGFLSSEDAGKMFARELLGKPMTNEELAIEAAENNHEAYIGEDF